MKKRQWLSLFLAVILSLAFLSACGESAETDGNGAPQEGVLQVDYWVNEIVDKQASGEKYQAFHDYVQEQTGVDLVINYYDWGESYNQKMNMYAAGQDLPAGIWNFKEPIKNSFNLTILNSMGEAGMFYDWTPYLEDTATYATLKENANDTFLSMTVNKTDGANYIYPCNIHYSFPHAPGGFTVRQDWLDQCGLDYPTNEEEFYNMLVTFKNEIKDEAGNAPIPFSISGFYDQTFVEEYVFRFILNSWMGSGVWYEHDGRYDYAKYAKTDELKMAMVFFNRLWREDLFDKETFSQKKEQIIEKSVQGQIGVCGYSYDTTYPASDALMQMDPAGTKCFVNMPPISMNPSLPVEEVNSCEIIAVPMNCLVVNKEGIGEADMEQIAKAVDFIGTYEANLYLNMGEENVDWEKDGDRIVYTDELVEARNATQWYNEVNGFGLFGSMNTHPQVMASMLSAVVTQPDRIRSCENIRGHQVAITDAINAIVPGDVEVAKQPLIENAWTQMVIRAISAASEEECIAVVDAWPQQLQDLGYEEWVEERTALAMEMAG